MITVRSIQDAVCRHFGITRDEMLEQNRKRNLAKPRQIAMILARDITRETLTALGIKFCRDQSTVSHAVETRGRAENDPVWGEMVAAIRLDLANPREAERRHFELHMRERWKESVPFHLTPEGAINEPGF